MLVTVSWKGKLAFEAKTESGHRFLLDTKPKMGGEDKGPRPTEVLLACLAGCTGMDVASILTKKKVDLESLTIKINGEQSPRHPKYFTKIEVEYNLEGRNIKEEDVKQAIELSKDKYCSVAAMLKEKATISYRWNLTNE